MKFKSKFLFAVSLLSLSACGHFKPNKSGSSTPTPNTTEQQPASEQSVEPALHQQTTSLHHEDGGNTLNDTDISYHNLLERIRAGFKFPELTSPHVEHYQTWNSTHPTYLNNLFKRAEPFLFYIVEEIKKRDLPMELALLPAVESAYRPNAYSRSKAAGLWQFIPSTGRHFKLRQDWWYDARKDVVASTQAALDYLTQLHQKFNGDWFLALAAYNAGGGTINKAIRYNKRKGKPTNYQHLNLRSETERYVPKLIALKNIVNNPDKFNVQLPVIANKAYFVKTSLPRQIDLDLFAQRSDIKLNELRNLNAGFLRWASPPNSTNHLLIPIAQANKAALAIASLEQQPSINYKQHKVMYGDTLGVLAQRYNVSISSLKSTNKLSSSAIRVGKYLMIPLKADNTVLKSDNKQNSNKLIHRVQRGDTLWSIARRYQVKVQQLLTWNQLSSSQILSLNQSLLVYRN